MPAVAYPRLRRTASPGRAGLRAAELSALVHDVDTLPGTWCAGAVVLVGRGPYLVVEHATGWAVRYAAYDPVRDAGRELPRNRWTPARADTVFDLASLSKLFTAIAVLQQVERGTLDLDAPIAGYVRERGRRGARTTGGAGGGREVPDHGITVRQLLAHTSGLRPELPLYRCAGRQERLDLLWAERPGTPPGSAHRYSDLNLLLAQQVLESVAGRPLDVLVRDGITRPLGMTRTRYRPPRGWRRQIAATEDQRRPWAKLDRGPLHGEVHDENAYALGGVAGHAGLFSTAGDLAVLCRTLLTGGSYGQARILAPSSVALLLTPPGLGFAVDQPWFMGELAGPPSAGRAAGHTGFTGTSLVLDPATDTFLVLLANTVHPVRRPADSRPRAVAATHVARAVR
ncbi:serine hydrolase [Streptomyces sp. JJ36]|uniref:serine hydrolase domain-containing protein n=1 Tax=Streptomyces sp. JJ36 TaxID=2736645 RepID=UPI001F40208C|nr:serine hydrolase [Streptomyces sp. JJ36]MCF6521854.1 serine hydrolase [Streptomyces sp. JJ36]